MTIMEKERNDTQQAYENELISPRQAAIFLSELWEQRVTVTSLRMLRLHRKDDPDMPEPDFSDEQAEIYLWTRSTLRKIKPPKRYKRKD